MWDLPRPGLEPVSSALVGKFLTTVPEGKSPDTYYTISYGVRSSIYSLRDQHYWASQSYFLVIPSSRGSGLTCLLITLPPHHHQLIPASMPSFVLTTLPGMPFSFLSTDSALFHCLYFHLAIIFWETSGCSGDAEVQGTFQVLKIFADWRNRWASNNKALC